MVKYSKFLLILLLLFMGPGQARSQNVGFPFLKIGIGARQAGLGGAFTGVGDDIYTMYWNPGGLGHIRRWQWSASYNQWFADVYQANLLYAKQFRFLGSRKTAFGVAFSYLGMPDWNSTGSGYTWSKSSLASAGHMVGTLSLGQRLDWISKAISIGGSVKMIRSQFDDLESQGYAADVGVMIRPRRFNMGGLGLGVFEYGIFTVGASLLHYGESLKVDEEYTSLPETWRAGASLKLGRYNAWTLLLAADMEQVEGRDWITSMGAELWWRDILGFRVGHKQNGKDLEGLSLGFGLRWDDVFSRMLNLPTRYGDGIEIDLADVGYGDVLNQTYRGSVSHYSVAPEPFLMDEPQVSSSILAGEMSVVTLDWEATIDPDPFDEVGYYVLVDKDSMRVARAIHMMSHDLDAFMASPLLDSIHTFEPARGNSHQVEIREGGVYYWAVAAHDLAKHVRLAKRGVERVSQVSEFVVATHDLMVGDFRFDYSPWITETPEQGTFTFSIQNAGQAHSGPFTIFVNDHYVYENGIDSTSSSVYTKLSDGLAAGEDTVLAVPWSTTLHGLHRIEVLARLSSEKLEFETNNNLISENVMSIPKGRFEFPTTVEVMATGYDSTDIPVVPEVYFPLNSSELDPYYYDETAVPPPVLQVLAMRMRQNDNVRLEIMGSIDALSNETDPQLAEDRAVAVRRKLIDLGVRPSLLRVVKEHENLITGQRAMPNDTTDARRVMEQDRVVTFRVDHEYELAMFGPMTLAVDTTIQSGIPFDVRVYSPAGIVRWQSQGDPTEQDVKANLPLIEMGNAALVDRDSIAGEMTWLGLDRNDVLVPRDKSYDFQLVLSDDLQRTFRTHPKAMFLREKQTLRKREIFGSAKYAQTKPVYDFYWDRLLEIARELVDNPTMRVRFEGHACAIGSEEINQRLSDRRAQYFTREFRRRVRLAFPQQYQNIWNRIESSIGYGEKVPLTIKLRHRRDEKLLGDNNTPTGRYLNRRIMVLLYKEN